MGSSTVIILLAFLCMATAIFESHYETYSKQDLMDKLFSSDLNQEEGTENKWYPEDFNTTLAPPDNYSGSYGDLLHWDRQYGDQLLHRETFVNVEGGRNESIVFWYGIFNTSYVTHVRSLNFGRERGWTKSIDVSNNNTNNTVEVNVIVPANNTVRLFFEVYGYPRQSNLTLYDLE